MEIERFNKWFWIYPISHKQSFVGLFDFEEKRFGDYITERELPPGIEAYFRDSNQRNSSSANLAGLPLDEVAKTAILHTLRETGGNKSEAARILQITRTTLNNKIKKYRIDQVG